MWSDCDAGASWPAHPGLADPAGAEDETRGVVTQTQMVLV